MIIEIEAEYQSDAETTKDTPYLALTGELWGVFCEYLWENQPRYNGTALYVNDACGIYSAYFLKELELDWCASIRIHRGWLNSYVN